MTLQDPQMVPKPNYEAAALQAHLFRTSFAYGCTKQFFVLVPKDPNIECAEIFRIFCFERSLEGRVSTNQ